MPRPMRHMAYPVRHMAYPSRHMPYPFGVDEADYADKSREDYAAQPKKLDIVFAVLPPTYTS